MCIYFKGFHWKYTFNVQRDLQEIQSTSVEFHLQSTNMKTNDVKNIADNEFIIACSPSEYEFRRLFCLK